MTKIKSYLRNVVVMAICLSGMAFIPSCDSSKDKLVKISFEGKNYDNLYLSAETNVQERMKIEGASSDGYSWTFVIPDSISKITSQYEIVYKNDSLTNANKDNIHIIDFLIVEGNDTLKGGYFNFDKNKNSIELKGKFSTTKLFENKFYIPDLDSFIVVQTIVIDHFFTEMPKNEYLRESMQTPTFSFFYDSENPDKTYEEFLAEYAEKIKKNPNSLYYITLFSKTPHFYKSMQDYENLYNLFSPEMQNSKWGKMAKMNFATLQLDGIYDITLPNPLNKENEKIIVEPAKFTLFCFSASWCGPCRKKIPMLKEIHEKTKDNLNLVYLTIDDNSTIDDWNRLMEMENITWRNLWLTDQQLKKDWQITSIPDFILVYPDGNAKKILLKEKKDAQELYALLNE